MQTPAHIKTARLTWLQLVVRRPRIGAQLNFALTVTSTRRPVGTQYAECLASLDLDRELTRG
jgi:hypothetical protein